MIAMFRAWRQPDPKCVFELAAEGMKIAGGPRLPVAGTGGGLTIGPDGAMNISVRGGEEGEARRRQAREQAR
jgi:hypothetical protein